VFSAVRRDIEDGTVEVGAKLSSEAALAAQYGVSRSVIREALRSCNALGLTVTKTGKGTFVVADRVANDLALGQYSARDLNEARPHIEVPAAGLAAKRRSPEDLEHLKEIVESMLAETDPETWVSLDASFHSIIARASGNKVFESVVADIRDALAHQSETLNMVADRQHDSDDEHLRIVIGDDGQGIQFRRDSPGLGLGLPLMSEFSADMEIVAGPDGGTDVRMDFPLAA